MGDGAFYATPSTTLINNGVQGFLLARFKLYTILQTANETFWPFFTLLPVFLHSLLRNYLLQLLFLYLLFICCISFLLVVQLACICCCSACCTNASATNRFIHCCASLCLTLCSSCCTCSCSFPRSSPGGWICYCPACCLTRLKGFYGILQLIPIQLPPLALSLVKELCLFTCSTFIQ